MFVVLLRLSDKKALAPQFMESHNAWIKRGFEDGVFVLTGTLQPKLGGTVFVHNTSRADLEARVNDDPFVHNGVVEAEILEVTPGQTDERLAFLAA